MKENDIQKIRSIVEERFEANPEFDPDDPSVPLAFCPYGADEVMEALESMLSTYVTMGEKVEEFEQKWSDYLGADSGVMTNSGSSANLAAMKAVAEDFPEDAEVIVPAVGWSTAVFPVVDAGATPVFVDVDPEKLHVDTNAIEAAINEKTEAIIVIHLLGNPAPMDRITQICEEYDLVLVEDCAEAHGAEFKGRKVGSIGDIGTFSFSFSHHITTTEGGMAVTDSRKYRQRMKILRSWGRIRDVEEAESFIEQDTDIDSDFMFASHGYNLRPTEIQAAFGIHQTGEMDDAVEERRQNAAYLNEELESIDELEVMSERQGTKCSYLHFPMIVRSNNHEREEFREYLEENGIETRPLLSGNMARHPAFRSDDYRVSGELEGADVIHENGLYIGNHHRLTQEHLGYIVETVKEFFRQ